MISKSFTLLFDVRPAGRPRFSPCNFMKQQVFSDNYLCSISVKYRSKLWLSRTENMSSSSCHLRPSSADQMCDVRDISLFKGFYAAGKGALFL